MGLDVYLHKVDDVIKARDLEAQYETKSDALWGGRLYETFTDAEKEAIRAELNQFGEALGLNEWGGYPTEKIEIDSAIHPEHYFKIGYLSSSHNSGGLNSVMKRAGLPTLYDIFLPNDNGEFQPDWDACLQRSRKWLEMYDTYRASDAGKFDVVKMRAYILGGDLPNSENAAKDVFLKQWESHKDADSEFIGRSYSCRDGQFYLDGLTARGFILGTDGWNNQPVMYVVIDWDTKEDDWYRQAIEITAEMCEWAAQQPDRDKLVLHWSS